MNDYPRPRLYFSERSPFARRIRIYLADNEIDFDEFPINAFEPPPEFERAAPLGLVPALFWPNAGWFADSSQILEFFDDIRADVWPKSALRHRVRQASTLATGIMQATVSAFIESGLKSSCDPKWMNDYFSQIESAWRSLENFPFENFMNQSVPTQAGWDWAIAKDYLNFRFPEIHQKFCGTTKSELWTACEQTEFWIRTKPKLN